MTSFVLQQDITDIKQRDSIVKYANFLRQPLKLEMFINCDDDGNVLKEPKKTNYQVDVNTKCSGWKYLYDNNDKLIGYYDDRKWKEDFVKYKQSKEKVLFEGIEFRKNGGVNFLTIKEDTFAFFDFNVKFKNLTIEYLIQYDLQLIENAVKQIGI